METAKIDIRKLQLLNDRISHTIDALNQVRMSVHGLSHSNPLTTATVGYGWNPMASVPSPIAWNTAPVALAQPVQTQPFPQPFAFANVFGGLSHSTPETQEANIWNRSVSDLSYLARINQTFPFAYSPIPAAPGF